MHVVTQQMLFKFISKDSGPRTHKVSQAETDYIRRELKRIITPDMVFVERSTNWVDYRIISKLVGNSLPPESSRIRVNYV